MDVKSKSQFDLRRCVPMSREEEHRSALEYVRTKDPVLAQRLVLAKHADRGGVGASTLSRGQLPQVGPRGRSVAGVVMSVRVFVANDHGILRGALSAIINMQSDMEVVGEAATGSDAEIGIKETEPDVVVMDINGGGLDAIASLKRLRSGTRTVVLTFQEELGYIRGAAARGYVVKRVMNTELLSAIRAVAQELTVADASIKLESVQRSIRSSPTDSAAYPQGTAGLTDRELRLRRTCARRARPSRALIDPA